METWRLLAGLCVLLVVWFALMVAFGYDPGPEDLLVGLLFAVIGLAMGEWLSNRIAGRDSE